MGRANRLMVRVMASTKDTIMEVKILKIKVLSRSISARSLLCILLATVIVW